MHLPDGIVPLNQAIIYWIITLIIIKQKKVLKTSQTSQIKLKLRKLKIKQLLKTKRITWIQLIIINKRILNIFRFICFKKLSLIYSLEYDIFNL